MLSRHTLSIKFEKIIWIINLRSLILFKHTKYSNYENNQEWKYESIVFISLNLHMDN